MGARHLSGSDHCLKLRRCAKDPAASGEAVSPEAIVTDRPRVEAQAHLLRLDKALIHLQRQINPGNVAQEGAQRRPHRRRGTVVRH
jgi:hypothetical protein